MRDTGQIVSVWYTLSSVIFSFLFWSKMILYIKSISIQKTLYMQYVIPPIIFLLLTQTKYPTKKIPRTNFMRYRRQSVAKNCTKLTLSTHSSWFSLNFLSSVMFFLELVLLFEQLKRFSDIPYAGFLCVFSFIDT